MGVALGRAARAPPAVDPARWAAAWEEFERRMDGNFPFFHPRFAGQMLKPPHPVAAAGYVAAMLVNPNNHALDGGPATSEMEKEAVAELAAMLGLAEPSLGHLTASGTIANLEALWVARELHPDKGIVYGANAHYTHARMCQVLRMPGARASRPARTGRIDLDALDAACARGDVGTVVLTGRHDRARRRGPRSTRRSRCASATACGSTSTPPTAASSRCSTTRPPRLRVDRRGRLDRRSTRTSTASSPTAAARCCSPIPAVGRLYAHDSPYTYFTSDALHLGEISLECSRAGAAAAALWLTLRAVPLAPVLAGARRAARASPTALRESDVLRLLPRARARHRHLPPAGRAPVRASTPPPPRCCARAWTTPTTRCS